MPRTGRSKSRNMHRIYPSSLRSFSSRSPTTFVPSPYRESGAQCLRSCWTGRCFCISNKVPGNRGCTSRIQAMPAYWYSISLGISDGYHRGLLPTRLISASKKNSGHRWMPRVNSLGDGIFGNQSESIGINPGAGSGVWERETGKAREDSEGWKWWTRWESNPQPVD